MVFFIQVIQLLGVQLLMKESKKNIVDNEQGLNVINAIKMVETLSLKLLMKLQRHHQNTSRIKFRADCS